MHRLLIKVLVISALFLIILPGATLAASIHPTANSSLARTNTPTSVGKGIKDCKIQVVQLHETQPATMTCADQSRKINQKGSATSCNNAWVSLWWDQSEQGPEICFAGNGYANMTGYCAWIGFICHNWNDNASSYSLQGCILYPPAVGDFTTDINGGGQSQPLNTTVSRIPSNFDGQNSRLPNDTLSSVLVGNCY